MVNFNETQLIRWMKLSRVKGLGPRKIQSLAEFFGSIDKIFEATPTELVSARVFKEGMLPEWRQLKDASDENFVKVIRECASQNIKIMPLLDEAYPLKLKRLPAPPLTLFLLGDASLLNSDKIAVVGTRQPSEKARKLAFDFAKYFADQRITVVSGGAEGIDSAAHEGALASGVGKTVCVLGSGFFKSYPSKNESLFERIRKSGGLLVSEHLPNFPGSSISLIQRNRITSGLSDALLVCASKEAGGSMIQTKIALEQRIPIFCPSLSLDVQPNEGIRIAITDFGAREVNSPQELLSKIKDAPKSLQQYL
ncbi:MAG: DNA-processing protein DprA [Candidatus Micrarchaeota archaeon]